MQTENSNVPNCLEIDDQKFRSVKRTKNDEFKPSEHGQGIQNSSISYKESLMGNQDSTHFSFSSQLAFVDEESDREDEEADDIPTILLSKEEKNRIRNPWKNSIIVKTFGKSVGYHFLYPRVKEQWRPSGIMDCIDLGRDYFLFRFHNPSDFQRVIYGGPWFVGSHYLTMRLWEPGFLQENTPICSTTAVWVRLPGLSIELFDKNILQRIGNQIGTLLKIDTFTEANSRGRYARIYVQIDIDKPLIPKIRIGKLVQNILYEGVNLCFQCGLVGHRKEHCKVMTEPAAETTVVNENMDVQETEESMNNKKDSQIVARTEECSDCARVQGV